MAQVTSTLSADAIQAHNKTHSDRSHAGMSHYDPSEYTAGGTPVEQSVDVTLVGSGVTAAPTYGASTALAYSILIYEEARRLFLGFHIDKHNSNAAFGTYPYAVWAHNGAESVSSAYTTSDAPTLPSGSAAATALVTAFYPMANDLLNMYELGHRRDKKFSDGTTVDFHSTDDVINYLGTAVLLTSSSTGADLAERFNLLQRVIVAHLRKVGGTHSSADTARADVLEAVTPVSGADDWDGMKTVGTACQVALDAHRADAGIHNTADTFNDVTATMSYPTTLIGSGTLPRVHKTKWNAHLATVTSTGVPTHANAPALDEYLTYTDPTTIAEFVAGAAEIYAVLPRHFRSAPISVALRSS